MSGEISGVSFTLGQTAWTCAVFFDVKTTEQFSDARRCTAGYGGGHSLFSAIVAFLRARRGFKQVMKREKARPGEREAKGWIA